MAKMTINGLQGFVKTYVDAASQAGAWNATTDNLIGLIDKVGKQITIDGSFQDKLGMLDGDDLPLGKTIEEWFQDLVMVSDYDENGTNALAPAYPAYEEPAYSYTLGRKVIKTTIKYDDVERAAISAEAAGNMTAKIMERLANSYSLYTYAQKKQLIGNMIDKACAANLSEVVPVPVDTTTSETFIKKIKEAAEDASFANEGNCLSKTLIGAANELVLFVKKGVIPTVEVDALAGAFNSEKLALPAKIVVVDDFGTITNESAYAVLVDPRGIKLHKGYHAVREQMNADGDFLNVVDHSENTGFISKHTFVRVFK